MGFVSTGKRWYVSAKRKHKRVKKWTQTPQTPAALALQAYNGVKYLKGLVNSEMLYRTLEQSGSLPNGGSGGIYFSCVDIAQGDDEVNRTGNSIFVRSINCRFEFQQNAIATNTIYRMILAIDTQTISDETAIQITQPTIFQTTSTQSFLANATAGRFKILKNWYFTTDSAKATSKSIQYYYNLRHHVRYNGPLATDIQRGNIFFFLYADQPTNLPTVSYQVKTGYHDN